MSPKLFYDAMSEYRQKANDNLKECWELIKLGREKKKELKKLKQSSNKIS